MEIAYSSLHETDFIIPDDGKCNGLLDNIA